MSQTEMTKGSSVCFSDNMRRLNHMANICWLSQIRRCGNLRSWLILPVVSILLSLPLVSSQLGVQRELSRSKLCVIGIVCAAQTLGVSF